MDLEKLAIEVVELVIRLGGEAALRELNGVVARRVEDIRPAEGEPSHTDQAVADLEHGDK